MLKGPGGENPSDSQLTLCNGMLALKTAFSFNVERQLFKMPAVRWGSRAARHERRPHGNEKGKNKYIFQGKMGTERDFLLKVANNSAHRNQEKAGKLAAMLFPLTDIVLVSHPMINVAATLSVPPSRSSGGGE
ncbi:MAG: hypothetical protein WA435_03245 [Gallionellaceae bacterium]